ncbi:MAG: anhydro-N-acetylmuramic acid kinase [Bacteroidota bacterium]
MQKLFELSNRKKKLVIGIMSGTSLDGVDLALVEINGCSADTSFRLIEYLEYPFPEGFKELVIKNSSALASSVEDICRLNFLIPQIYCDGIAALTKKSGIKLQDIDLIGSHGQTIHHLPEPHRMFGYDVRSTLQIGDPSVIAKLTGIITVGDFRVDDIALNGQGAPLVPYFDYITFRSRDVSRALLNIGGISNFSIIPASAGIGEIMAFDTGPGNMIIDALARHYYSVPYDEGGVHALNGSIRPDILEYMKDKDGYIEKAPPKSTGRELYGESYIYELLNSFPDASAEDMLAAAAEFTAYAVYRNYEKFILPHTRIDELIISGGGARNEYIVSALARYFGKGVKLMDAQQTGVSSDAKEAICFAILANELLSEQCANVPAVTGASRPALLGKICLP